MPVEIKELVIRAVVERPARAGSESGGPAVAEDARSAIVEACVKQVLKVLKRSQER